MLTVFEYFNHFQYLKDQFQQGQKRGKKKEFSEFIGVQATFLSQVLKEKYALSPEQADRANQYFDHSTEEASYFLLMVLKDRASTTSLRGYFQNQLTEILNRRKLLISRMEKKPEVSDEAKGVYYSSWLYAAVHVGCTIPHLRTRRALAEHFGVSPDLIGKILDFLERNSFLRQTEEGYTTTESWVRLGKESPHVVKLHTNWRMRAVQNFEVQTDDDLHYSGVFSIDQKAAEKIKEELMRCLQAQYKVMETAREEELYVLGIDFFNLKGAKARNQ